MQYNEYQSPLVTRYSSKEMSGVFSPQFKYSTWRKLWLALAEAQKSLGIDITDHQIQELKDHVDDINFNVAEQYEDELHHDVMAHIRAYGDQCPEAKGIIHLGATSCYVTDNGDLLQILSAIDILENKLIKLIRSLSDFCREYSSLGCIGYTHFQQAQLTTVGKRGALWLQDLVTDYEELMYRKKNIQFLGVKGATGTQASFLALFNGDHDKVRQLDQLVAKKMGFGSSYIITGQTYPRKQDVVIINALVNIAISTHKFATDLRLLSHLKEITEPFEEGQVGSSAMPYKKNPILSERICSIARFVMSLGENPTYTAATQWLERSLDDSANRRIVHAEAFLATDGLLNLMNRLIPNLVVNRDVIKKHVQDELPFIATENILMASVKKGCNRQVVHERIRQYAITEADKLIENIKKDDTIPLSSDEIDALLKIDHFIGRAPQQVEEYLEHINSLL